MKNFANFLVVLGVCVASLGASGFHTPAGPTTTPVDDGNDPQEKKAPSREDNALTLFAFGTASLIVGGYLTAQGRRSSTNAGDGDANLRGIQAELEAIHELIRDLPNQNDHTARERIGKLLEAEFFDLTSKSDDLVQLIGSGPYAKVWDGVAVTERLLARSWSMFTDGYPDQARSEIPLAATALESSIRAMREL